MSPTSACQLGIKGLVFLASLLCIFLTFFCCNFYLFNALVLLPGYQHTVSKNPALEITKELIPLLELWDPQPGVTAEKWFY